jgi:intracellular sulfur oxidation DsrE/DsrF family protein
MPKFAALIATALVSLGLAACATPEVPKQKVVYHINQDGGAQDGFYFAALGNVRNHLNAVGADKIEVKVVMHGNGLGLVKNAKANTRLQSAIAALKSDRVDFLVCKNTMTARNIAREDLYDVDSEDIVVSGVAELTNLQHKGYTYVKP